LTNKTFCFDTSGFNLDIVAFKGLHVDLCLFIVITFGFILKILLPWKILTFCFKINYHQFSKLEFMNAFQFHLFFYHKLLC
jgi:hypothetical protein